VICEGTIAGRSSPDEPVQVLALTADREVAARGSAGTDGRWRLEVGEEPAWVVARTRGSRLAAAAARPADAATLVLAPTVTVAFEPSPALPGTVLWIDPLDLDGFPGELLAALQSLSPGVVELHGMELPADVPVAVELQRGTYALSGGRLAVTPLDPTGQGGIEVLAVEDEDTGDVLAPSGGAVTLPLVDDRRLRVRFGPPAG
jgi:hypothetical protein